MPLKEKALICPLDWGIGHATRCVPVITKLEELGFEVVVAAFGRPLEFIRREYPRITVIDFPGVNIKYPQSNQMALNMLKLLPQLLYGIWHEHLEIKKIALQLGISLIISDNRYGCWHASIPSVFMTHQLSIQVPGKLRFIQGFLNSINRWFINRYDACWIPDFEPHRGLAGVLSHPKRMPVKAHYIGILSRFSKSVIPDKDYNLPDLDLLVMLSGPEPQRTILEEKILRQLSNINMQVALVRGMPEIDESYVMDKRIHVFSHLDSKNLRALINRSMIVICRSGYSSIMDMVTLGKRAIFIPTPGQTEQEYLSRYLMEKKIYFSMGQHEFDLLYALEMSKNFPGMVIQNDFKALEEQIEAIKRLVSPSSQRETPK
ncbi:MAG: glycosyltransferase [Bacteroidetes bacterium]|nr:glycosyltransferase [Bacteroidota bacterium]